MFLLIAGAVALGFFMIFLIGVSAPKREAPAIELEGAPALLALDAEQLGKVVAVLLDKMGLELDRASGGGAELEIWANNPAPVTGGRLLVHCVPAPPETGGRIQPLRVQQFIGAVRSARVTKGLFFTTGDIGADARLEAEGEQVELFDRHQLQGLIERHLGDLDAARLKRLD